tara:strand:- start:407 stop:532 length:126 start_codon:yes stop_codon:yes gene_type:complete
MHNPNELTIKDYIRGSLVLAGMLTFVTSFLVLNGLFWGGAL